MCVRPRGITGRDREGAPTRSPGPPPPTTFPPGGSRRVRPSRAPPPPPNEATRVVRVVEPTLRQGSDSTRKGTRWQTAVVVPLGPCPPPQRPTAACGREPDHRLGTTCGTLTSHGQSPPRTLTHRPSTQSRRRRHRVASRAGVAHASSATQPRRCRPWVQGGGSERGGAAAVSPAITSGTPKTSAPAAASHRSVPPPAGADDAVSPPPRPPPSADQAATLANDHEATLASATVGARRTSARWSGPVRSAGTAPRPALAEAAASAAARTSSPPPERSQQVVLTARGDVDASDSVQHQRQRATARDNLQQVRERAAARPKGYSARQRGSTATSG